MKIIKDGGISSTQRGGKMANHGKQTMDKTLTRNKRPRAAKTCRVGPEWNGMRGTLTYNHDALADFIVEFPDEIKRNEIIAYLRTEREYWIPDAAPPGVTDQFRIEQARPTDSLMHFELA